MSLTRRSLTVSLGAVALALAACTTPPPPPVTMPPPVLPTPVPPPVAPEPVPPVKPEPVPLMTPSSFAALPGWEQDDQRQAWPALLKSCAVLARKADWLAACTAA